MKTADIFVTDEKHDPQKTRMFGWMLMFLRVFVRAKATKREVKKNIFNKDSV